MVTAQSKSRMSCQQIIRCLNSHADSKNVAGMIRFGINAKNTLGVNVPVLRKLAKKIGKDHALALQLWNTKIHEARLLAGFIADHKQTGEKQMERWVRDFDSWDICDQVCANLFDKTPFAYRKAAAWSRRPEEFVKRAGFALMAALSVHDKKAADKLFVRFLPIIRRESKDGRNFVRKAVNWALRQIGKRNCNLNRLAIETAKTIARIDSKSAKWIAADALRELTSSKIKARVGGSRVVNC